MSDLMDTLERHLTDDASAIIQKFLANPVPGRVELMGFKCVENRLNTFNISVAMPSPDLIDSS